MKKLLTALTLAATAITAAPAMADDDARIYERNKAQYITHDKAGEIAKSHVNGSVVKKVEFDHSRRLGAHFDVDVITAQGVEYDVSVDAKTGKVLKSKIDD
ncbi:PepSY domain-containing protein [Moraxella nasibovis]|uniref:PepSY domain-containing protein n=1 Tax=Moraxella nasibovis TaxID=2904120 RepID=UPI00240F61B1|nr:PepSY domain-containing protein [Moraxella nasibovis]WFF38813.1 PepSY domain-containing protein [Moraxella nasibovis]